ncbi:MAG: type II toxin-antitoxin system HicB family antitoxin [Synergistaceae bacterium]
MKREYSYPAVIAGGYDGGRLWVANFPGLSGCWAEGESRDEVVSRAPDTLGMYIKSCIEAEIPIPEPLDAAELRSADVGEIMVITCFAEEQE